MRLKFSNKFTKNLLLTIKFLIIFIVSLEIFNYFILGKLLYKSYDIKAYKSSKIIKNNSNINKVIILIHGIYGNHNDLMKIAEFYANRGYEVISIQYPSTTDNIENISKKYIDPVIKNIDKNKEKYIIAHSMGTIVTREYLINNKIDNLKKVVFISPPSKGTNLADSIPAKLLSYGFGKSLFDLSTKKNSFVNTLKDPDYTCKVFIGNKSNNYLYSLIIKGKDDGMVPIDTARLNSCDYELIDGVTHKSILRDNNSIYKIKDFIEKMKD